MKIKEIINNWYNRPQGKERKIGFYHASEIWSIYKGYINPTNFFKQTQVDKQGQANMFRGSACEDMLCKIFTEQDVEFKTQERFEIEIEKDVFVSGKLDFNFPDYVLETKCPDKPTSGIPDKWTFQLETYSRMTGKKVYLGIFDKQGSEIIRFFPFTPSEKRWELIKQTLIGFNEKLIKKYNVKVGSKIKPKKQNV